MREGRVAPMQGTFDDIRASFMERERMKYKVLRTDKAEEQLRDILFCESSDIIPCFYPSC